MNKKIISFCLTLCILIGCLVIAPVSTYAEVTAGDSLNWSYADGTLTISGTGDMTDFADYNSAPWFSYRDEMKKIVIEEGVTSIGAYAFYAYMQVTELTIPESVTSIGYCAFWACDGLVDLIIPDGVKTIGERAFMRSYGLKSVTLGNGITEIGSEAFRECDALETISINAGVRQIGDGVFGDCSAVTRVSFAGSTGQWHWITREGGDWGFSNVIVTCAVVDTAIASGSYGTGYSWKLDETGCLYFATAGTYKGDLTSWEDYEADIAIVIVEEGVTAIPNGCFMDLFVWSNYDGTGSVSLPSSIQTIGSYAFANTGITKISFPDGLTSIGDYAFSECSLDSIILPDNVKSIGEQAFANNLASEIVLGESLTSIDNSAFYGNNITELVIPASLKTTEAYVFSGCAFLQSVTFLGNNLTEICAGIFQNCRSLQEITIPEGITTIGGEAFYGCKALTTVSLPDSLTTIESQAFYNCSALSDIVFPESLTSIGNSVFSGCDSLKNVTLPVGLTNLGYSAFSGCDNITEVIYPDGIETVTGFSDCSNLKSVQLPANATSIADYAFSGCTSLTSVVIPDTVGSIGTEAFRDCSGLINIQLSANTTLIADSAFSGCTALTSIVIPDTVGSIGTEAFRDCSGLESITMGYGVTTIGSQAFLGCSALKTVDYTGGQLMWEQISIGSDNESLTDAEIRYLGSEKVYGQGTCGDSLTWKLTFDGVLTISGTGAMNSYSTYPWYTHREMITAVVIEEGVATILGDAFRGYPSITEITIPESLSSKGMSPFCSCSKLETVNLGENTLVWSGEDFYGSSLQEFTVSDDNTAYTVDDGVLFNKEKNILMVYPAGKEQSTYRVPDGVIEIAKYAFYTASRVNCVVLNEGLLTLGDSAFRNCSSLKQVDFSETVTTLGSYLFGNCTSLEEITIPESVTQMGANTFYQCTGLIKASIDANVSSLDYTFQGCSKLEEAKISGNIKTLYQTFRVCPALTTLELSDTLTSIGSYAFYGCSSLTEILIPKNVTSIGSYAFYKCTSLENAVLPDSICDISGYCFSGCTNLNAITLGKSLKSIAAYAFQNCNALTNVYYTGSKGTWSIVTIGNENTALTNADIVFADQDNVVYSGECGDRLRWKITADKELIISGYGAMDDYNYSGTTNKAPWYSYSKYFTSIAVEEGVTYIGSAAFANLYYLTTVSLPDSITAMGKYTFAGTSNLNNVILPKGLISIPQYCFYNSKKLTAVLIPEGVTCIEDSAFSNCSALTELVCPDSITTIAGSAFHFCSKLSQISLGSGLEEIKSYAFNYCSVLKNVYYNGTQTQWNGITIGTSGNTYLTNSTKHYSYTPATLVLQSGETAANIPVMKNGSVVLSYTVPTELGYAFSGWATTENATTAQYAVGSSITLGTGATTLYPVFEKSVYTTTTKTQSGATKTYTVTPVNVPEGSTVVLVCYRGKKLVHVQKATYTGEDLVYNVGAGYRFDTVKILTADQNNMLKAVTQPEILQ